MIEHMTSFSTTGITQNMNDNDDEQEYSRLLLQFGNDTLS